MVEMVEILDGRLGKRSVERVRYVIKKIITLGHCEINGVISLVHSYFVFPLAFGDNTVATREISRHISR